MQLEAAERRDRIERKSKESIDVVEVEQPGVVGDNDHPRLGQIIDGMGSGPGEVSSATVSGNLRQLPSLQGGAVEPDGSILLAHDLSLSAGELVELNGVIGDGEYGSNGARPSGDFDFVRIQAQAGQVVEVFVRTFEPLADLNPIVGLYDGDGNLLFTNDNVPISGFLSTLDSYLRFTAPSNEALIIAIGGFSDGGLWLDVEDMFPNDPFDPSSGPGAGSEGEYSLVVGLDSPDPHDCDFFRISLRAGDIVGATAFAGASAVSLVTMDGDELVATAFADLSGIYPESSPLPGGGRAALAWVIDVTDDYAIGIHGLYFFSDGAYTAELGVFRPPLEAQTAPEPQVVFLDFDGASLNNRIFGIPNGSVRQLSPLAAFLPDWGLAPHVIDELIQAVVAEVQENLSLDVRERGGNGDYRESGVFGEFEVEIRNSREHPDPFGEANVSRVIIGGSIEELGLATIGIAESVDVGNFETEESAVVLLDLLSAPEGNPNSLNGVQLVTPHAKLDLVARVVGNIAAHEAGHLLANFHTERDAGPETIMDRGGRLDNMVGAGPDGVFGTADDVDVDLGPDTYSPAEAFFGTQHTLQTVSYGLPAPGARPYLTVAPESLVFGAIAIGEIAHGLLNIGNRGALQLTVDEILIGGAHRAEFALVSPPPGVVNPGESTALEISFRPISSGRLEADLVVVSNDPQDSRRVVPMVGFGGRPGAVIVPSELDFGVIEYGETETEPSLGIEVSNEGDGELWLGSTAMIGESAGQFEVDSELLPISVTAGQSRIMTVTYRPAGMVGEAEAILWLELNDPAVPWYPVELKGRAWGPDIDVQPDGWSFGPKRLGTAADKVFGLSNVGQRDLVIGQLEILGENPGDFAVTGVTTPTTLAAGTELEFAVFFLPVELEDREAVLLISSNDPDEAQLEIELFGRGVAPELVVAPEVWDFTEVAVGGMATRVFKVSNVGEASVAVEQSLIEGDDSDEFEILEGGGSFGLAEGGVWPITVGFAPSTPGYRSAHLRVVSADPLQADLEVPLMGQGVAPVLSVHKTCIVSAVVDCSLTVVNHGPGAAFDVVASDRLPAELMWLSDVCDSGGPVDGEVKWLVGDLEPGESSRCSLTLGIEANAPPEIVNVASVVHKETPDGAVEDEISVIISLRGEAIPALAPSGVFLLVLGVACVGWWSLRNRLLL